MKFYRTPRFVKALYPSGIFSRASTDSIFLTFDDGPCPVATPWVVEQLEKCGAKATFFCVGKNLRDYPEIAQQVEQNGHTLGNHTYSHVNGWKTNRYLYQEEVEKTEEELRRFEAPNRLFRPPYGKISKRQLSGLNSYEVIFWSHMAYDYAEKNAVERSVEVLKAAKPGSIVLFHDSERALPNLKQILPELLDHYNSKGIKMLGL